ncbi:MAG: rhodanese-like domain-containing protein [Ekhidna sp.]|nr:rhodanese-like domain-containing protein [Ekhidna sp.]
MSKLSKTVLFMVCLFKEVMYKSIYLTVFVLLSCQQVGEIEIIDSSQLKKLKSKDIPVVDIRTQKEYNSGHIPEVLHIDFMSWAFMEEMEVLDKNKPVIIYCAVGGRSGLAAKRMLANGFKKIYDYSGGFNDWKNREEEIEK